jgi:hydrogenase expression/formation protein HypE
MRDATRGGLATVLCELAEERSAGISLSEQDIPVREQVAGACEIFGFDPLYVANEGKVVMVVDASEAEQALELMRSHPLGADAQKIGYITEEHPGMVVLDTQIGGRRIVDMLVGEQLPRIC